MSPTRRSSSPTSRSYLHQLAAPLPHPSTILASRRSNAERGPHNILDSIPPIVESTPPILESIHASTNDSPDRSPNPRSYSTPRTSRATEAPEAPEAQDQPRNRVPHLRRGLIADKVAYYSDPTLSVGHQFKEPQPDPSTVEFFSSHPPQPPVIRSEEVSSANRTAETLTSLPPTPSPRREYTTRATSNPTLSTRTQPVEIHIGAVEVRLPAPPPPDPRPVSPDLNSIHTAARPARPYSRSLTWTYGLIQG